MEKQHKIGWLLAAGAWAMIAAGAQAADAPAKPVRLETPTVEVVGTTPLPGVGVPVDQVPANVYAVTGKQIQRQQAVDLSEFLDQTLSSVNLNSGLANGFQPDLNYRGFTGSPLLGIPQGISVYIDGVRVNEAFGDVVNWDLIPHTAISSVNLIPGSNPVFGLNTLGGALSVNTKSGREYPGASVSAQGGSFGRRQADAQFGGQKGPWDVFVTASGLSEQGWRDHSASRLQQLFGKVGYETGGVDLDLSYNFANNHLEGTQLSPLSLLAVNPAQAYTYPDNTRNKVDFLNLRASRVLEGERILSGNVYYRKYQSTNFNSNLNNNFAGGPCTPAPPADCPASNLIGNTTTRGLGSTVEYSGLAPVGRHENKWTIGASYDNGRTDFSQASQDAVFTADRNTIGIDDFSTITSVRAINRYLGLYATDTFSLTPRTHLTLSGRYNRAQINLTDKTGSAPGINGVNQFNRLNPAVGLNYNPNNALSTFVAYNEGMRAPTPVELTCADPGAPCQLPNAFLSDPPLKAVIARTMEAGLRGRLSATTRWSVSAFRTGLRDDIEFVSANATGTAGYFQNVPKTRRQGLEASLEPSWDRFTFKLGYSLISATYQSAFTVNSPNNSSADGNGNIGINPGNRIPGIVRSNLKLRGEYNATERVTLGFTLLRTGGQYARGDENNQDVNGQLPGYTLLNLDARWRVTEALEFFGRVNNAFDRTYQTFGALGQNFFNGPGFAYNFGGAAAEQFRTPGTPRALYVGVRYDFGTPARKGTAGADRDD